MSEIRCGGVTDVNDSVGVPRASKSLLHAGKGVLALDLVQDEPGETELQVDGEVIPEGEDLSEVSDLAKDLGERSDLVLGLWRPVTRLKELEERCPFVVRVRDCHASRVRHET